MKHAKIWISVIVIVLALVILVARNHNSAQLPEPDQTTLAGPQTSLPDTEYNPTAPLSKPMQKATMNIEITKDGTGETIRNGQTAVVSYVGKLENGTIFDASKNHGDGSFSFTLGAGQVIKGWDQGVLGMQVGESRTLTIPPELAYGPSGIPPTIPPNATLIFDVTLLGIK
jgi:FKBP-type peptidyl-prolyl cis-trans isomerase